MTKTALTVGQTLCVAVDPAEHNGNDQAAAIVTGVHDDGTLQLRVFGDGPLIADSFLDHVNDDGTPHDYTQDPGSDPTPAPVPPADPSAPVTPPAVPVTPPAAPTFSGSELIDPATQQTFDSEEASWKFDPITGASLASETTAASTVPAAPSSDATPPATGQQGAGF